jgi:hypothetical protein
MAGFSILLVMAMVFENGTMQHGTDTMDRLFYIGECRVGPNTRADYGWITC